MAEPIVEWIDHTADVALRVTADTPADVFTACAAAMIRLCVPDGPVDAVARRRIAVDGGDLEELLVAWLSRINALISAEDFLAVRFLIERLDADGPPPLRLAAVVEGETVDPSRHAFAAEIKAVTHHACVVAPDAGRWTARVVFDV